MARTLKTSGIATSLTFLLGIEDDNTTVKVFKSVDTNNSVNTSDVNANMTVHANVSKSTMSWNGHTVPYMTDTINSDDIWVSFPTGHRPCPLPSGAGTTITTQVLIGHTPNSTADGGCAYGGGASPAHVMGMRVSGGNYMVLQRGNDNSWLAWSASGAYTADSDETWAAVYNSTSSQTCRFYRGVAGSSLSQNNTNPSDGWTQAGEMEWIGSNGTTLNWRGGSGGTIIMIATFAGEIASGDLSSLHGDPYGTLFEGGAPSGGSKGLMMLGIG